MLHRNIVILYHLSLSEKKAKIKCYRHIKNEKRKRRKILNWERWGRIEGTIAYDIKLQHYTKKREKRAKALSDRLKTYNRIFLQ